MDLTAVMPSRIQSTTNVFQCQPPLHLPSSRSFSSRPLPSIPSSTRIDTHIQNFSLHNDQQHPFYNTNQPLTSNNNENCPLYNTNQPFPSHNTQQRPLYDTNFSSYPLPPTNAPVYHPQNNNINVPHNFLSPTPSLLRYQFLAVPLPITNPLPLSFPPFPFLPLLPPYLPPSYLFPPHHPYLLLPLHLLLPLPQLLYLVPPVWSLVLSRVKHLLILFNLEINA